MHIKTDQLAPVFLEAEKIASSEVWNKHIIFSKGEKVQLVAPSGSGKTSFVHFLYGLRKDYKGKIFFNDQDTLKWDAQQWAEYRGKHISIVFQDLRLFTEHSVTENIQIKRELNPFENDRIAVMANRLGIGSKLLQNAGLCSYGERQRIAIIRALQQPFDLLVLDEPFSHLDEANAKKAMLLIDEEVSKRNAGIILADLARVEFFRSDRILHL